MDASLKTIYAVDEEQSLLEPIHTLCHHPNSIILQLPTHLQHAKRSSRNRVKLFQNKDNQKCNRSSASLKTSGSSASFTSLSCEVVSSAGPGQTKKIIPARNPKQCGGSGRIM